nr:MAG TPA: hypothetical protein [Caudoviricetes sp.]
MPRTKKKAVGIPTIDVSLVVVRTGTEDSGMEIAVDTANKVGIEPQTETEDAVKLTKLGRLLAQKPATTTITGHQITLTDNVFIPELVKIFQGGTIDGEGTSLVYTPPVAGSDEKGEVFEIDFYSAEYDASGQIVKYEKITYPNCQGTPITINTEDGVFRLPEYTINSAPKTGQAPYTISYVASLPTFPNPTSVEAMSDSEVENKAVVDGEETGLAINENKTEIKTN